MSTRLPLTVLLLAALAPALGAQSKPDAAFEAETLKHFQSLIQPDTSSPPGNEIRAVEYLKQVLDKEGIAYQVFAKDPQRPNLVARLKGNVKKRPLFDRLRSREPQAAAPALEYLGHVLPRQVFRPVTTIFEGAAAKRETEQEAAARDDVAESIRAAWGMGDGWLRACAVRASRHAPSLEAEFFAVGADEDPLVTAEIAALLASGPGRPAAPPRGCPALLRNDRSERLPLGARVPSRTP